MSTIERMTITMPADLSAVIKRAVETGDYASTSEVIREAVRDWKAKRNTQVQELEALKTEIATGLADLSAGRVKDFNADEIADRGRKLLAKRTPSTRPTRRKPTSLKSGPT